jgi:O-antigen/teichoic acid export membrane protein
MTGEREAGSARRAASYSSSRFVTHVGWTFAARLFMLVNSVLAGIIVARRLGAEGLGALAVINITVATTVQLGSAGLPSANTYLISLDKRHLAAVAINSLIFVIIVGGLLAATLAWLAAWRPAWFGFVPPGLIIIAALSIPFQLITLIGLNIFLAAGHVERFNLLDLFGQSFVLINSVAALVLLDRGLRALVSLNAITSIAVAALIAALVGAYAVKMKERKAWRPDAKLFWRAVRYGVKFHVSILAGALIFRADLLVVNHFRGEAEAGVYSVASQIALMLMLLPGIIATLIFPRISASQDVTGEMTCVITRHTALLMLFVCAAAASLSLLLPLVYGTAFADAGLQLLILLPGVYLIGLESVLVQHLNAMGLPRTVPLFWLVTLAVNLALIFGLVPFLGARGAAIASTASYALIFLLVAFYFRAVTGRSLYDALVIRKTELRSLSALLIRRVTSQ